MSHHDKHGELVKKLRDRAQTIQQENSYMGGTASLLLEAADALLAPSATLPAQLLDQAADIYNLMLRSSKSCRPMEHLLTTDGLYHLNIANLHVRSDGREYVMEADWAKLCGKLVKAMKELRDSSALIESLSSPSATAPISDAALDAIIGHFEGPAWRKVYSREWEQATRNDLRAAIKATLDAQSAVTERGPT